MEPKPIDIVIISYERWAFTEQCLRHIHQLTTTSHRVIVVDNGSRPEVQRLLQDAKQRGLINVLVLLDKNYGLEPAKNIGLSLVTSEYYVDSDNDCICAPPVNGHDWLSRLLDLAQKNQTYAAIACPPQVFIGADKAELFKNSPEVLERKFVGGSLRLMRTSAVNQAGGWRSNPKDMTEANRGEEHYICGKLLANGHKVGYARDVECFHLFGEDGEWGYGKSTPHYHRDQWPRPVDSMFGSLEDWLKKYVSHSST